MVTATRHPLAGKTVTVKNSREFEGQQYRIEDYWTNVGGRSWMDSVGNPACLDYAIRSAGDGLPMDDNVVYGKIGAFGKLMHESQLGDVVQ